jgi:N-acetylated-alpha-linked acidic dipeptidase
MVTVMEVGRALGELYRQGWRPQRTIILCAWDGEEPALLGSTEWVEQHAEELKAKAVAYINSDSNGKGFLNAGGSHTLERLVNEVANAVQDPRRNKPLSEVMRQRRLDQARTDEDRQEIRNRKDLRIAALGSGSDYTPFIQHLGIASLNTGFGGESDGGVYHSIYDSFAWYTKYSDTTFEYGRALAQFNGTLLMRLAGADVLPFEFTNLADTLNRYVVELEKLSRQNGPPRETDFGPLRSAIGGLTVNARRYEDAFAKASSRDFQPIKQLEKLNGLLYQSERKLTSDKGLPRRPWFKHQIYAPGFYTGYGVKTVPGVREAIEQKQWNDVEPQMKQAAAAINALAAQIDAATRLLEGK